MLGKEDSSGGVGGSQAPCQVSGNRKNFWRSASWSSSRTSLPPLNPDTDDKDSADQNGNSGGHRRFPAPLTPRSQQNWKSRSSLPPLQPLAIARRSLDEWPKAGSDDVGEWPLPSTPSGRDSNNGGERLKLDLSSIQRIPDKNGGLVKREKIAFFDKECSKVAKHIYLGGDAVARDKDILKQHGITHILNCVGFVCPEYFKSDFVYRTLWLQDSPSEDITSILYDVFDYFEDVREQCGKVLVHCCQGVSRSTSLVIAYLMWREGQSFDDAFQYVKAARGIADPNMGFACQLLQCQKRVHAFPLSPSSLLRMYRIAPHSPYDPMHLVPKMLNTPSPDALDSRGAFIIHIPSVIYVWIGKKCEAIMERDARGAICQIVRYEKVQGPFAAIKDGEEPSYFWDAFSNLLPLMDKSVNGGDVVDGSTKTCPSERKVDLYNVDFEIFQKAISGGFVPPFASSGTDHETHLPARESEWSVLRRKFAVGNMKEFVTSSKFDLSRVYPDSTVITGVDNAMNKPLHFSVNSLLLSSSSSSSSSSPSSTPSSSSSSLSSSSSPPYLSPDSVSSDSSIGSKYFSESPVVSPSTLSSFSNLSFVSSRLSPQSISKSSEYIDVNFASQRSSKKSPLSIAERRGSMPKSLRLPIPEDSPSSHLSCDSNCSPFEHNTDISLDSKEDRDSVEGPTLPGSSGQLVTIDSCNSDHLNVGQPVVYRWPSMEKVVKFGAGDLDSGAVFVFIAPSSSLGKTEDRVLYFWVGRNFYLDKSKIVVGGSKELGKVEEINWDQVSSGVLTQMGLLEGAAIKVAKEDEEPAEFLALLSSL